jgi:NAD(P)-dependent dehydrogenase (short-subunit alcohol dehydrogenase family)
MTNMPTETVVVTAAGHGIGAATARLFARRPVNLVVADVNEEWLATIAAACEAEGVATVLAVPFDQRQRPSVDRLFEDVDARFGRIDALANIVGNYPNARVTEMSDEMWEDVISSNLTGLFYCCQNALTRMLASGGGSIVNVTSPKALVPGFGFAAYAASKGGVDAFTRVLALEAGPSVRVNAVRPGGPIIPGEQQPDPAIPMRRMGQPEDIADAIAFLMSPQASFITGQIITLDGGRHMH